MDIEAGEEICINYLPISLFMKNRQMRQDCLLNAWGFSWNCTMCLEEFRDETESNQIYSRYMELQKEHEQFGEPENFVSFDVSK